MGDKSGVLIHLVQALLAVLCVLLGIASQALFAQQKIAVLHPGLGETIGPEENEMYRIFGPCPGLVAARVYEHSRWYVVHILADGDSARLWIFQLSSQAFRSLRDRLRERMQRPHHDVSAPFLYPLQRSPSAFPGGAVAFHLTDGSVLNGTLVGVSPASVTIRTLAGLQVTVPDAVLDQVRLLAGRIQRGTFYRQDPNTTRLLLAPTARPLPSGRGYIADYFLFFPTFAMGITGNLSLGAGISLIPAAESQLAYLAPRLAFTLVPRLHAAVGGLKLFIPDEKDVTLVYNAWTLDTQNSGWTFGAALPLSGDEDRPILLIGAETQVSQSIKLLTENWIFTGSDALLLYSGGIRFFGERLAVDFALVGSSEGLGGGFPFIPWVDFSYILGR